jgi:hypothetical protein
VCPQTWGYKGNNKLTWVARGQTSKDGALADAEGVVWVGPLTQVGGSGRVAVMGGLVLGEKRAGLGCS